MLRDWHSLSDDAQLALSRQAMRGATMSAALAGDWAVGTTADHVVLQFIQLPAGTERGA